MKMMRLLSSRARQNVTYLCKNSIAWSNKDSIIHDQTIKVLTDDEVELHGNARDTGIFLDVRKDECKVIRCHRKFKLLIKFVLKTLTIRFS